MSRRCFLSFLIVLLPLALSAQTENQRKVKFVETIRYNAEMQISASDGLTPLWLTANKHGLSSLESNNGYVRGGIFRDTEADSLRDWKYGFGFDAVAGWHQQRAFVVHQMYADVAWRCLQLSVGAKERDAVLTPSLSSGSQTFGTNARPIPQIRFEIPNYLALGKKKMVSIKGHFGFGMLTDGRWQRDYVAEEQKRNEDVIYHSKAGYMKFGNEEKFPLTFEGGLEMACLFGGTVYNRPNVQQKLVMSPSAKDFFNAVIAGGADATDGDYANAAGNTVGSWILRLNWDNKDWRVSAYYDHFFEDHSAMFFEYGWLDGLLGLEVQLPKNRVLGNVVYEYMNTTYQSGPIYHDETPSIPDQVSARDDYYNNFINQGWQHWGQAMGNPLFVSPLYSENGQLGFPCNRFRAHHIGLSGMPLKCLGYKLLYTHTKGWGTYILPSVNPKRSDSFLCELTYAPSKIGKRDVVGWSLKAAFAMDRGSRIGNNTGFQLTLCKSGFLKSKR